MPPVDCRTNIKTRIIYMTPARYNIPCSTHAPQYFLRFHVKFVATFITLCTCFSYFFLVSVTKQK